MIPVTWRRRARARSLVAAALIVSLAGCHRVLTPELHPAGEVPVPPETLPVLKAHMMSGELYVLDSWTVVENGRRLEGTGIHYSMDREQMGEGPVSIGVDEVALFETNQPDDVSSAGTVVMGIMTTVTGAAAVYCLANPKSCFGSCPTFYVEGVDAGRPAAEGFSSSFARALEARDVDALPVPEARARRFALTMRNEALETHAVRRVRLLATPRPAGGRVFAGIDGRFYPAVEVRRPRACRAEEGDCRAAVASRDGDERASPADPHDLATRETVVIELAPAEGRVGLVLAARQTLLTTYLFYQSMAYFGSRAGEYLATLERGGPALAARATGMARALGGIEVAVSEGGGEWRPVGIYDEAGPIATDVQVLPFEATGGPSLRVRLRLAKGHWRIDQVALARLGTPVTPQRLSPIGVERGLEPDPLAWARLEQDDRHLVTFPGDEYRLSFALPEAPHGLELFLETEGYYYEWMRDAWLADEDAEMASLVLFNPREALRRLAEPFKQREPGMERAFWASRFRR
ncbi:MAG: hypothetical protein LJF15_15435 [Acidobacteria bacterium]|jgi:hypothetical protein|nr:hypothetical protein [Acidobacteriota bacterium]